MNNEKGEHQIQEMLERWRLLHRVRQLLQVAELSFQL
jgi:hypothetical protein